MNTGKRCWLSVSGWKKDEKYFQGLKAQEEAGIKSDAQVSSTFMSSYKNMSSTRTEF